MNLLRVLNDILRSIDSGSITILTMLDLSAVFATIDHSRLLNRLSVKFGISGTALTWLSSDLTDSFQSVLIEGNDSSDFNLMYSEPQGSILGPVLFTMYMLPLGNILKSTFAHPDNLSSSPFKIQNCCDYVGIWMHENKLKVKNDKTEVLLCSTKSKSSKVHISNITLRGTTIVISDKAKKLGIYRQHFFYIKHQINAVVKAMYFEIRNMSRMKSILSYDSVKTLVTSLVLSCLDYCNSLLVGIIEQKISKLQKAQYCAARLVLGKPRSETSMLQTLHWLPVKARMEYKISVLCYNTLHSSMPSYLKDLLHSPIPCS